MPVYKITHRKTITWEVEQEANNERVAREIVDNEFEFTEDSAVNIQWDEPYVEELEEDYSVWDDADGIADEEEDD